MSILFLVSFVMLIIGVFTILDISFFSLVEDVELYFENKKTALSDKVDRAKNKKKQSKLVTLLNETKLILKATGKENKFTLLLIISLILFVLGMFIGTSLNNIFLTIILCGGFSLIPFWYIKLVAVFWKRELHQELETALSIVTSSYMRTGNIISAIEDNLEYINSPVKEVFTEFSINTKFINSNTKQALEELKTKIDSDVFCEWVEALILCQDNKSLKGVLPPIVAKLSDMRVVSAKLDNLIYEPIKEFFMMSVLLVLSIPFLNLLSEALYDKLMYTTLGKCTLAFSILILFISVAGVIKESKPIEYKR